MMAKPINTRTAIPDGRGVFLMTSGFDSQLSKEYFIYWPLEPMVWRTGSENFSWTNSCRPRCPASRLICANCLAQLALWIFCTCFLGTACCLTGLRQVAMSQKCFECWLIVDFFQHRCHCHPQHFYCVFISTLALPWSFLLSLLFLVLPWHWQLTSMIQDRLRLLFKHHHHHSSIFCFHHCHPCCLFASAKAWSWSRLTSAAFFHCAVRHRDNIPSHADLL